MFLLQENTSRQGLSARSRLTRAFTLVESVMAIGIVSFAMVSILGLIPVGLGTFRKAMNLTVETTILQAVSGELLRTDYANVKATNFYFDQEGVRVAGSSSTDRLYTAEIGNPANLDSGGLISSDAAKTVPIKISNRSHPDTTNSYFVVVPRSN